MLYEDDVCLCLLDRNPLSHGIAELFIVPNEPTLTDAPEAPVSSEAPTDPAPTDAPQISELHEAPVVRVSTDAPKVLEMSEAPADQTVGI
ncbi:unnamed protein product [Ilex paraguariensis]|uniref:Uncharacterized protein n=1 Tax=Ilex paraguariensis TaxID=185542 RepID=A0ABC8T5C4_9AQUA